MTKARYDGWCDRCDKPIYRNIHDVARVGGKWIHARCGSGASDE